MKVELSSGARVSPKNCVVNRPEVKKQKKEESSMSTLAIILLILILSICWSSGKMFEEQERGWTEKMGEEINGPRADAENLERGIGKDWKKVKGEKLRKDLQERMRILVRRIIENRRSKISRKKGEKINFMNRYDRPEFPVGNNPELAEVQEKKRGRNGEHYRGVIGQSGKDIPPDLGRASPERLIARHFRAPGIRKVGGNLASIKLPINRSNESENPNSRRTKRAGSSDPWIKSDFKEQANSFKMHALVVRDQNIPPCCSPAPEVTDRRYFMCSGSVLSIKHAITTASCMHFADVHKTEIQADLGVYVGATSSRAYVIKITRFEMHPHYNFDVDAPDYEVHNLAIIYLDCNIVPLDVGIPKLPKGFNDDVAHLCCGNQCDIFTIVQRHDNRHIARLLKVKHVPSPRHKDEPGNDQEFSKRRSGLSMATKKLNGSSNLARPIRSSTRLAAAPFFFGKDSRSISNDRNSEKNLFHLARKLEERPKKMKTRPESNSIKLQDFIRRLNFQNSLGLPLVRSLKGVNVEKELAGVDWGKIEETMASGFSEGNRYALENFSKNVVDETIRRLEIVLSDGDDESSEFGDSEKPGGSGRPGGPDSASKGKGNKIFSKLLPNRKNKTVSDFVKVFTSVVTSLLPPNNNSAVIVPEEPTISENEIEDPSPIYQNCPPLGSPVIINDTLIGLLAYSCDDAQNWVEWKYVNMAKNMKWIRNKISEQFVPKGRCAGGEKAPPQTRSLGGENRRDVWRAENTWKKKENGFNDRNVDWSRTEEKIENVKRNEYLGNFENVGISGTDMSFTIPQDPWLARNSQLPTPQQRPPNNRAQISDPQNSPVYKFNTCYVKPDGNIDCTTATRFDNL